MSKSMVAVITAVITAVVSVCSTLVVVKYTGEDGTEKEVRAEIQYEEDGGDDAEFESYELSGGQQTVSGDTSMHKVNIKSARIAKDFMDRECVVITYMFTNNGDEPIGFSDVIDDAIYQNGVALNTTDTDGEVDFKFDCYNYDDVKPGVQYEVRIGYLFKDKSTDLNVELKSCIGPEFFISKTFNFS